LEFNDRGHKYKILRKDFYYHIKKNSFTNRVVNIWNSLPDYFVDVDSISSFKSRLYKF